MNKNTQYNANVNPRKCIINIGKHKKIESDILINRENKEMFKRNTTNIEFFLDDEICLEKKIKILIDAVCECFPGAIKCKLYEYKNILFHLVIVNDGIYYFIDFCSKINIKKINNILYSKYKYICFSLETNLSNTVDIINEISLFINDKKKYSFIGFKEIDHIIKNMDQPKLFILLNNYTNNDGELIDINLQEDESKKIMNYDKYMPIIYDDKNYDSQFLFDLVENMKENDVLYLHTLECLSLHKLYLYNMFNIMLYKKIGFISTTDYTSNNFLENTYNLVNHLNLEIVKFFNLKSNNTQPLKLKPIFGEKVVNGKHIPDPKEKEIIELIRKYAEEDMYSLNKITFFLNKNGIPTKNNKIWYIKTVKNIIEKNNIKIKKHPCNFTKDKDSTRTES